MCWKERRIGRKPDPSTPDNGLNGANFCGMDTSPGQNGQGEVQRSRIVGDAASVGKP
jgi:hypothetical protein